MIEVCLTYQQWYVSTLHSSSDSFLISEGGVAGEGRVVGVPKFHSWGKCTMLIKQENTGKIFKAVAIATGRDNPTIRIYIYNKKCSRHGMPKSKQTR